MSILNLLSLFDALCVHDAIFFYDKVVKGTSSIDPIRLLELLSISQSVKKEKELRVVLLIVDCTCQLIHLVFDLAHLLLFARGRASIQCIAHIHNGLSR